MALFKYANFLTQHKNGSFDLTFQPSAFVPCSGIYRCTGCGTEIASEGIGLFPDRTHHKHGIAQGPIVWQLVVATVSHLPAPYLHGAAEAG
jgi:hypothetical protein